MDTASDFKSYEDGLAGFRDSEEHAEDIGVVIQFLRQQAKAPVRVVGTSRGHLRS